LVFDLPIGDVLKEIYYPKLSSGVIIAALCLMLGGCKIAGHHNNKYVSD